MNKIVTVNFRGAELYGLQAGGVVYVALKPIVEAMGLSWGSQYNRVQRNKILSEGIFMMKMPFAKGGPQQSLCLRLDLLHGWLFTIDAMRVRRELQERVLLFQRECYEVLYRNFSNDNENLIQRAQESESLRVRLVAEARQTFGQSAAQQLWKKLELPYVPAMAAWPIQQDLFGWAAHNRAA